MILESWEEWKHRADHYEAENADLRAKIGRLEAENAEMRAEIQKLYDNWVRCLALAGEERK